MASPLRKNGLSSCYLILILGFANTVFVNVSVANARAGESTLKENVATKHAGEAILHHGGPNHLSLFLGSTRLLVPGENDDYAFTVGLDYEYRLSRRYGLGAVVEYAASPIHASTALVALDVHLFRGAVLQLGIGAERIENETNELGRVGLLYEFELDDLTLSPQLHYDFTNSEDSIVFGLALGFNF